MSSDTSRDQPTPRPRSRLERRLGQSLRNPQDQPAETRVDWFQEIDYDDNV